MPSRRRKLAILVSIVALGILVVDSRFLWTSWSPDTGGFCFTSEVFGSNGNQSYSVLFLGVNFTFLHWTYPSPLEGPNGTEIHVVDAPYETHIQVTFGDGTTEQLSLYVNGYTLIHLFDVPKGAKTVHSNPTAGVITAYTHAQYGHWQFTIVP